MSDKGMFQLVSEMNEAFGNPKGDPNAINAQRLLSQCKNIVKEYQELMKAFGIEVHIDHRVPNAAVTGVNDVRDALCDIMVFALGAYHFMGHDADRDMALVVEALYSRFCNTPESLMDTCRKYDKLGVDYYIEGQFPFVRLKSAKDQGDGEYPRGKFLKAAGYRTPDFPPV
jgi:hypothetical protein